MALILLSTHGTNGDVLPFVRLGRELAARGHEVAVLTHAWFADRIAAAGLRHVPIDTDEAYDRHLDDTRTFMLDPLRDPDGVRELYRRNGLFEQLRDEVQTLRELYRPGETVVVARHTSGVAALMAAELSGVPVALVAVSPSQYVALPVTGQVYRHVLGPGYDEVFQAFGLPKVRAWAAYLTSPRVQLALWPEWFDAAGQAAPAEVVRCGFVLGDTADGPVPAWEEPPVLITGGTGQVLHRRFYEVAAHACHRLGRRALLVTRHRSFVPDPLPSGVEWTASAPFASVMPHVAAVVHHGGMGTLARALASSAPQVLLAHGVDRPDNAERLERAGVARWLPVSHWSRDRAADLIAAALADDGYRDRISLLAADAAADVAVRAAAGHVEALIGTDGKPDRTGHRTLTDERARADQRAERRERLERLSPAQRARLAAALRERNGRP
ncbi:glycosyltransferase [Microbispora sp. RL4-1S]|uniref:Glycosyltransferase n=1 Tax=Microbispora oryzae TaxID=2806554 RepID=A0A941ANX7_9ACTN|nr:nucleotide disphospho-sugar-binding domain-containing protein [Microbispora oryzae]MBP2703139.1 glycosyltransferase [Microbispora oryzae]